MFFVFPFSGSFEDGEAGFFGVGKGDVFGGLESGPEPPDRFLAGGALSQVRRGKRAAQSELASADFAGTCTQFVFV